jgi:hypothetical protein
MLQDTLEDLKAKKQRLHEDIFRGYSWVACTYGRDPASYATAAKELREAEEQMEVVNRAIAVVESHLSLRP